MPNEMQSLVPYTPTKRERLAAAVQDFLERAGVGRYRSRQIGETLAGGQGSNLPGGMGLADAVPVVGQALAAEEGERAARRGAANWSKNPLQSLLDIGGGAMQAATVFHGSPHKFSKFDSAHIGKGEGAQAYGHGLYFADNPAVAGSYAEVLGGGKTYTLNGKPVRLANMSPSDKLAMQALTDLQSYGPTKADFLRNLDEQGVRPEYLKKISESWDRLAGQQPAAVIDKGSLYKVDLPDEAIARMLDWDKPLADQSAFVAQQLERAGMYEPLSRMSHGTLWHDISAHISNKRGSITNNLKRDQAAAAEEMRKLGIPGIRYLDGGSRGAGAGTYNYVVFPGEENMLRILERNGVAP